MKLSDRKSHFPHKSGGEGAGPKLLYRLISASWRNAKSWYNITYGYVSVICEKSCQILKVLLHSGRQQMSLSLKMGKIRYGIILQSVWYLWKIIKQIINC